MRTEPPSPARGDIDPEILEEAADWLMRLHAEETSPADWDAVALWRARSPEHGRAWARAETLLGALRQLPPAPARAALGRPDRRRRQMLRLLLLPALPVGVVAWQHRPLQGERWHTATGEQRRLTLADGTRLLLNTATAIEVRFDAEQRLIRLHRGELLIHSTSAPQPLPLRVATADGLARPQGARFSLRRADGDSASLITAFEGSVEIDSGGVRHHVAQGQRLHFSPHGAGRPEAIDETTDMAWTHGMIIARSKRLADLVAELGRYRNGLLRCHPSVADLRVSGTFPALDSDRSLRLLTESFPLRVRTLSRYWVTLQAA